MPAKIHHQTITRQSLRSAGIPEAATLIEDYSSFPDYYHTRYNEVKPYLFIHDDLEFHYPPHTPVDEFYRYWNYEPETGTRMVSTAANCNRSFSEAGFKFYLDNILLRLSRNQIDEAYKFLGCLLHYLQDSTFGIHALEGPDGTDIYTIDRMSGRDFAKYVCAIPLDESFSSITVSPEIFASHPTEFPALLYRRYCDCTAISRQALFDTALDFIIGKSKNTLLDNQRMMFNSSVQLSADTIATIFALANDTAPAVKERRLSEFAPFHYPIGGGGGFQLKRYSEKRNCIKFGINVEAKLLYHLPENFYSRFSAEISGEDIAGAVLKIINNGSVVREIELSGSQKLPIDLQHPRNEFGFIVKARKGIGSLSIDGGIFSR